MSVAVITAIYDGYDTLKATLPQPGIDEWLCVTDDAGLDDGLGWRIVHEPWPGVHPNRAAKTAKLLPWRYADADASIWLDASFRVVSDALLAMLDHADPVAQFVHPWRDCVYDEAAASMGLSKYAGEPILAQVARYEAQSHPRHWGLWATGVIALRHVDRLDWFGHRWYEDCHAFSFQDQLSEAPALRLAGLRPAALPGTHLANPWLRYEPSGRH